MSIAPIDETAPQGGVGQVAAELDRMRALYKRRKPKRVLEIGVWYGGTLREWLSNGKPDVVVAVDPFHQNPERYEEWRQPSTVLIVAEGHCETVVPLIEAHRPYDWIFIDGDHADPAVRFDAEVALRVARPGGLVLFHDIAAAAEYEPTGPRNALEALRGRGYKIDEIVEPPEDPYPSINAHGIGIVHIPK